MEFGREKTLKGGVDMAYYVWGQDETTRYVAGRIVALIEAMERKGKKTLREAVFVLPPRIIGVYPPQNIKGWFGPYFVEATLAWCGLSPERARYIVKYRVKKIYSKNAFSQAFLDPNSDKGEQ